jgi:hypothetical protein
VNARLIFDGLEARGENKRFEEPKVLLCANTQTFHPLRRGRKQKWHHRARRLSLELGNESFLFHQCFHNNKSLRASFWLDILCLYLFLPLFRRNKLILRSFSMGRKKRAATLYCPLTELNSQCYFSLCVCVFLSF